MNKTFLLQAVASYTEGSMLIVIDSLDDFIAKFKIYHAKKRDFMLDKVPEYYSANSRLEHNKWTSIIAKHDELEKQFIAENNNNPFDFEFSTGCHYGNYENKWENFYDNLKISNDGEDCWSVVKEFLSDLPTGTHYLGDYCA